MKAYQDEWLDRLLAAKRRTQVASVCKQISADDTGCTDALTQALAREYLKLAAKYEALSTKEKP